MLAVTTRNKLRSWRFCLPMLQARRSVKEQLAGTPGLIRHVSAVASPTEFLTLTVWESREAMFDFMSAGAHENFMWMFSRWSASFWSMRWLPTTMEEGTWHGLSLATLVPPGDHHWRPHIPQVPLPEQRPGRVPGARFPDPGESGVYAITALIEDASPAQPWTLFAKMRQLQRDTSHLLRWSVSCVEARHFWVLTLWRDLPEGAAEAVRDVQQRLNASWTMCWTAGEYEIGHWNNVRLRQMAAARMRQQRMRIQ